MSVYFTYCGERYLFVILFNFYFSKVYPLWIRPCAIITLSQVIHIDIAIFFAIISLYNKVTGHCTNPLSVICQMEFQHTMKPAYSSHP